MTEPLRPSLLAGIAAAIAGGTAVAYILVIRAEGTISVTDTGVLSVFIGISACAVAAGVGGFATEASRRFNFLLGATVGLFLFGLMGIFSIGLPLLVGGVLTLIEVIRLRPLVAKGHLAKAEGHRQAARREARRRGKKFL